MLRAVVPSDSCADFHSHNFCILLWKTRAYIILTNTRTLPSIGTESDVKVEATTTSSYIASPTSSNNVDFVAKMEEVAKKIPNGLNQTVSIAKKIFSNADNDDVASVAASVLEPSKEYDYNGLVMRVKDKATSAKPIDYLVAGTEGLAWVVHFCFVLSLRKGSGLNPRGPVAIRAVIFLLTGVSILLLRSHVNYKTPDDVLPNLSLGFSISVVTLLILYGITLIPGYGLDDNSRPSRYNQIGERTALLNTPGSSYVRFLEQQDPSYLGTAMEDITLTSKLLFHWVSPLMQKGVRGLLNHSDDLYDLPEHISTAMIAHEIDRHIQNMPNCPRSALNGRSLENVPESQVLSSETTTVSLLWLLHKCFSWQFYSIGILKFIADCSGFMGPVLLSRLVGFIEDKNEPILYGYLYALLMFLSTLVGAFCNAHFTFWMSIVGLKIRAAIVTLVYSKTLHSTRVQINRRFTFGEIINFMSTDTDRVVNSCPSFHTMWSIPLQLVVTLYLLYDQIGIAFLTGAAFAIFLIPVNKIIANKIGKLSTKLMKCKDQRVRLTGEVLRGITTIKLNVWEEHFLRSILKFRENEIKYLKSRKYLDALCVYFWATTPVLISILTFSTYVFLGNKLTAKTVFTSMALLNMLIGPLNAFPWVLNGITEAWVSIKRIQRILDLPEVHVSEYYSDPPVGTDVMLKNATFSASSFHESEPASIALSGPNEINVDPPSCSESRRSVTSEDEGTFTLRNLNVTVKKGQLVGIMGKVGSGKSLFLDAILAEITKDSGIMAIGNLEKGFGYVKQTPWLQRGTIRDNILFGKAYDHNKYKLILKACALTDDLNALPKRDLAIIGEAGNTLSGGQKTRITLARAVYADKDIYLLDDILATLDVKVARHVFQNVVLGLLKNKTRIICTHQTQYLIHTDLVIEMSKGKIVRHGKPSDVLRDLEDYLLSTESMDSDLVVTSMKDSSKEELDDLNESETDPMFEQEFAEKGNVQFNVYACYVFAVGRYLAISILLSMILMQISRNITDLWLSYWVTHGNMSVNSTDMPDSLKLEYFPKDLSGDNINYYLTIYGILAALNTFFTLIRAFMFAYGGIQAAILMHKQLLKTVVRAANTFFDIQPLGRILNRFSSDTYTIDDSLPFIANILFAQFLGLVGSIVITAYGLPWIFLILAPLVPIYHWIQNHYRLTSRELKRLSSIALSPVYTHFNETLQGLSSIRAFRAVPRFKRENELFLEASQKTQFASVAASQWLALRLQFIGVALLAGVCVMAVLQHQYDIANPGLIGLAITYTLSVTVLLSGVVNAFTETERELIAVERVKEYLENTPTESTSSGNSPPYAWPSQGVIEFREVVLKYRDHLVPALKGISFTTRPAEKIGIVGRTGAGKSSILASLFRMTEVTSGEILIDSVNIQNLRLNALRSRLTIIPQSPFLFSGTVRENIDPLDQYPDSQIYKALEKCNVHNLVYRMGGLGASLEEGGSNLSAGQKQLFCLVRAVLHSTKILCIDEATANVDQETDKSIQTTIKSSFRSATVITIAHRIRTIMHCDRVLVMGDGKILEFDEPDLLLQDTNSYFYDLVNQEFSEKE
ncbi:multidrug resistance-associated protein 7 isoform X2 [Cephus cinctus]|uniref:ABC-type xenobiotic transporter n=1 Tax=Cephus cinctus TaxID=211228 RepID=A0AAJ7W633_CEPCN|nr:multidrug resistance-associated protein 7 isoform X2 [Cephus cinctus]